MNNSIKKIKLNEQILFKIYYCYIQVNGVYEIARLTGFNPNTVSKYLNTLKRMLESERKEIIKYLLDNYE